MRMTTLGPLYGPYMHQFVIRELELGTRVALAQDNEDCGWSALTDLHYEEYIRQDMAKKR